MESKKVQFFNKLSFITLLVTLFVSMFFFIPYIPVTLDASKGFLLSIGMTLSLFFWLIARLGEGKFSVPKDRLILFGALIPLVFLIASFFSSSRYISIFGSGFEIGTFGSMLVLFILFFLSSIYFQTEKRLWSFYGALFLGATILAVFELLNIFVGFGTFLPGMLSGVSAGNLVGSWNDFALLFGLIVLLSIYTIEFLQTKGIFLVVQYFLLVTGLFFLIIINMPLVWILVGLFSVIIFVYNVSLQQAGVKIVHGGDDKKKFPFAALVVVFVCLVFLIGNNSISALVSKYINISSPDVRPSITTTAQIAYKSILHNPVFGTGPNTFVIDWASWKPAQIAQTIFWNVDFTNGYSLLTTFLVTTGILGFLAWVVFLVFFLIRSIKSLRIALQNTLANYFIMTTLMVSIYAWATFVVYSPSIIMMMLAFGSSGVLLGILVYKQAIPVRTISFLNDPRKSFFAILGLMVLMIGTLSITYIYIEKFTSIIYFSKGLKGDTSSLESLAKSEKMLSNALTLDKNDVYYRTLSQIHIAEISMLLSNKTLSPDILKSNIQQLVTLAENSGQSAVMQNPKQYANYVNLGNVYTALVPLSVANSYESAVAAYTKAFALAPNNPAILLSLAELEFTNKNNSEAKKYIKQALDLKKNYTDAIFLLAQIETSEGNLPEAIKQAEYAAQVAPDDATVFFRLGLLRYNNSDYSGSVSAFEKAVILDNRYLNARYFLGQSYKKVGRPADARIQFEILAKLLPDNQDVKDALNSLSQANTPAPTTEDKKDTKPPLKEEQ
jgi:tetratricopeptide (TPR) repeat protein